jgi:hypothetical protein
MCSKSISIALSLLLLAFLLASFSCSKGTSPVTPGDSPANDSGILTESSDREVIAVYDAVIDPVAQTLDITPDFRTTSAHAPLTSYFPNVLTITRIGTTPVFYADLKLTHPYSGSGVDLFDPRIIAIVPANPGVSFSYPVAQMNANHAAILEPDGYTKLFDDLAPAIPGNTNPFKAYFKNQPNRVWSSTGVTQETQRWYMNLSGFGGPLTYKLIVDVSTNFPNPPQPVIDNAPEPVEIKAWMGTGITLSGGSAPIEVTILDWQGRTGVGGVICECPSLFNSVVFLSYSRPGTNPNEYVYTGTISNSKHVAAGQYGMLIGTWDNATLTALADEVMVTVEGVTIGVPTVITPPWLNFSPVDVVISGNYAYVAGDDNGMHIFNIQDPLKPTWVTSVSNGGYIDGVCYANGYVYATDPDNGILVIDVDPVLSTHIVKTIEMEYPESPCVVGSYLYVAQNEYLQIIDITNPDNAYIFKSVSYIEGTRCVDVANGYAFVGNGFNTLTVVDVDPPSTASVVKMVTTLPGAIGDITYSGGYVYCAAQGGGILIIDVTNPLNPILFKTLSSGGYPERIHVANGYAYVSGSSLEIVDIEPLSTASIVKTFYTPGEPGGSFYANGYLFCTTEASGLHALDVDPVADTFIASTAGTSGNALDVAVCGDYAYVADNYSGLHVYNVSHPESANFVKLLDTPYAAREVDVSQGYVYLADGDYVIDIIDVDPIDSMNIAKSIDVVNGPMDFEYSNGYVYSVIYGVGLNVFDVDPVNSASMVKQLTIPGNAFGASYWNGYAYISANYDGLYIFDVSPLDTASQVKKVEIWGNCEDVDVANGIAVVADGSNIRIVDVDPPESAYIIKTIPGSWSTCVDISGGYAFVGGSTNLQIVDIDPPESANITVTMNLGNSISSVCVSGRYAYVTQQFSGMEILRLW